ncbi:DegV family protein [Mycoplasmopsis ciconiae]|uniref:DegV family protein n=1 Tax=Mycoplasmopsis ciconiae TaxID=561067 RepID=A0ABU7MKT1_9BACT|nr:DegV family protein [Mycoplasmopsis ciconiae]
MKKIAIIVDSSTGLTKEKAQKKGWYFLPLHLEIDNQLYDDGININSENIFDIFNKDSTQAKTSSTKLGEVISLLDQIKDQYDEIIIYPISQYLSGQYQSLKLLENQYPNLHVIASKKIVQLITIDLLEFEQNINQGMDIKEAIDIMENGVNYSVSLVPKYNDFLVKGGRLHPTAATIAKLLKIVPVIKFENGELLKETKGRIFNKTFLNTIDSKKDLISQNSNTILIPHSKNEDVKNYLEYIKNTYNKDAMDVLLPSVVSIHTGPEALAIIVFNKDYSKLINDNLYLFK